MKSRIVDAAAIREGGRVDAGFFLSPGLVAKSKVAALFRAGATPRRLGGVAGIADIHLPKRFKRVYSSEQNGGVPYLPPYQLLEHLPEAVDFLAPAANDIAEYRVEPGTILQTCSGRNLGPAIYVDKYLSRFVVSHDMVRIRVPDERTRFYVLAFLSSQTGQALLRLDKSGSVVDHIDESQVARQEIPMLERIVDQVVFLMEAATRMKERARIDITQAQRRFNEALSALPDCRSADGWTIQNGSLEGRIDAAYHHPVAQAAASVVSEAGGVSVSEVAEVVKPPGRYKTIYVTREWGKPILSGRQIHQVHPVGLKYIAPHALVRPERYQLALHSIVYQADGRAEKKLGLPVMITADRENWLASGHVGRVQPRRGIDPGWLYLALGSTHARLQIKAKSSGSVVDGTYEEDMARVVVPPPSYHREVTELWELFGKARSLELTASNLIDEAVADSDYC